LPYLGKEADGELKFPGTAFLTLSGAARDILQDRIARLPSIKAAAGVPKIRQPEWIKPEILVRVRHLAGGDTLRHANLRIGLITHAESGLGQLHFQNLIVGERRPPIAKHCA
jgi:hypothetical protein